MYRYKIDRKIKTIFRIFPSCIYIESLEYKSPMGTLSKIIEKFPDTEWFLFTKKAMAYFNGAMCGKYEYDNKTFYGYDFRGIRIYLLK